jgi:hypothetical protein
MHTKEQIQNIAETLLPAFIPKDAAETVLTFHFTLPPNQSFKVFFEKKNATWTFIKYEEDER